jgi:hypothetical protein
MSQVMQELRPTHGDTSRANAKGRRPSGIPTLQEVMDIPAAVAGIYEMTEKEIKTLRSRVYALNKHNAVGWRWRTLVEPGKGKHHLLLIWRIH